MSSANRISARRTMTDGLLSVLRSSLDGMGATPRPLAPALELYAGYEDVKAAGVEDLVALLTSSTPEGPLRLLLSERLQRWDYVDSPTWADGTVANTPERRARIYLLLAAGEDFDRFCQEALPPYVPAEPFVGIAEDHVPWYDPSDPTRRAFFWNAYSAHLIAHGGWKPESVAQLDRSTTFVLERISDPTRDEVYPSRGLVVGHVQSGKTANFTGVIAKAADAGYRLIIVLAGTMNMLRRQTQRRIDKELLGKEFVEEDYKADDDWPDFVSHGGRPSDLGAFDFHRLTDAQGDYRALRRGIESLEFERADPGKPFNDPLNLQRAKCRIMVIKKNTRVLDKVAADFDRISSRVRLDHVPRW